MGKRWTPEAYRLATLDFVKSLPDHQDCADYVGIPPDSVVKCYGRHGMKATCAVCGWNNCYFCKRWSLLGCVKCDDENCSGCLSMKTFRGWSGCCIPCKGKGLQAPGKGPKKEEVIVVEDDDGPICSGVHQQDDVCAVCGCNCCKFCHKPRREGKRNGDRDWDCNCTGVSHVVELLDTTPPPSPRGRSKFPDNYWLPRDQDDQYAVRLLPVTKDSAEFAEVKGLIEERLERGRAMKESLKGYGHYIFEPQMDIKSIIRVENGIERECFLAAERKMIHNNQQRPKESQFEGSPQELVFHGTDASSAEKIARGGFKGHYTIQHAWGLGTYTDSNGQIAIRHSKKDLATGMNTLLVCRALIGRKASTTGGSRGPPEGYDSGGDGACGWINVAYQDNELLAAYIVHFDKIHPPRSPSPKRQRLQSPPPSYNPIGPSYSPPPPSYSPTSP